MNTLREEDAEFLRLVLYSRLDTYETKRLTAIFTRLDLQKLSRSEFSNWQMPQYGYIKLANTKTVEGESRGQALIAAKQILAEHNAFRAPASAAPTIA